MPTRIRFVNVARGVVRPHTGHVRIATLNCVSLMSSCQGSHTELILRSSRLSRIMTPEKNAMRLFDSGYNCAEAVLLATSQEVLRGRVETTIPRVATGFGGGMSRNGDVCGALVGGIMRIGLAVGRNSAGESRDRCYEAVDRFYYSFVTEFGTCKCRELTGLDLKTEEGRAAYQARVHSERCTKIVFWAARVASQIAESA
jgi:C_GCAxxG_C_C family probable redox protein